MEEVWREIQITIFASVIVVPLFDTQITYDTLEFCEDLREHRTDKCDFFPHEDINFESEEAMLARIGRLHTTIEIFSCDTNRVLVVGHSDTFWYLTSHVIDGERFGKRIQNAEIWKWDKTNITE